MRPKIPVISIRVTVMGASPLNSEALHLTIERTGFVQIAHIGMPLGDATHHLPRAKAS